MRHLRTHIHRIGFGGKRIEILRIGLPFPGDAFGERRARDILDAFHDVDQAVAKMWLDRGKADAAIAHHDRCHSVPAGWRQIRIPADLPIEMGVDIDPARRHQITGRIDFLATLTRHNANSGDSLTVNRHISRPARCASAINYRSSAND